MFKIKGYFVLGVYFALLFKTNIFYFKIDHIPFQNLITILPLEGSSNIKSNTYLQKIYFKIDWFPF